MRNLSNFGYRRLLCVITVLLICSVMVFTAYAEDITISDAQLTWSKTSSTTPIDESQSRQSTKDGGADVVYDGVSQFTLTATNSKSYTEYVIYRYHAQNYASTLTLTNTSGSTINISYSVASKSDYSDAVTYNEVWKNGDSRIFSVSSTETNSKTDSTSTKYCYVKINSVSAITGFNVSFASSQYGSYTYQIGENEPLAVGVKADATTPVLVDAKADVTLTAAESSTSGYAFYCWMIDGQILGYENGAAYNIPLDGKVYPVYLPSSVISTGTPFKVGNNHHMFWHLAMADAVNTGNTVVLENNYTLPTTLEGNGLAVGHSYSDYITGEDGALNYKIPANITFLIPYDDAHTGLRNSVYPQYINGLGSILKEENQSTLYNKGTLTIPAMTTVTSMGTLIVNGQQLSTDQRDTGSACGPHGLIKLEAETSKIVVQSGSLFCYGYIIGNGSVEVENGASVYELLQIQDWRGFGAAVSWLGEDVDTADISMSTVRSLLSLLSDTASMQKTNRSFVFSQYFIQNIEADFHVSTGATLNVALTMNTKDENNIPQYIIPFASSGKNALLNMSGDGELIREYDAATDRMTYTIDCDLETGGINFTFGVTVLSIPLNATVDTKLNIWGVNNNISFIVKEGNTLTIASDIQLLPESSITVEYGADLVIKSGNELFIYDKSDWMDGSYAYTQDYFQVYYSATKGGAPAVRTIEKSAKLEINGELTVEEGAGLYTTVGHTRAGAATVADRKNMDKIITGTGVIYNNSTATTGAKLDAFEFRENNWIQAHIIETVPFVGRLAGIDSAENTYNSFGTGTYTGLGADHNNLWYQTKTDVPSNCTEGAHTAYTCDGGTDAYKVFTAEVALGHKWADATCTAPKTCSVCKATEGDAMGHSWSDATCTAPKTCSLCGKTEGESLGHEWADADCDTPKTCSVCGVTEGEALGHKWNDATCTTPKTCSVCGATEGEALGHTWADATCTTPKTCSVCGATEGEALGHDWDEGVYTAPTVDANGFTTYTCNNDSSHTYVEYDEGTMLTAVAQVGEKKFATLAEALEAGNEVKLLANIELDTPVVAIGKTIDFNGHTVTGTLLGTIKLNGGLLITKDEDSYKMIGKDADYYRSEDAVFSMDGTGSITIHSGTVELAQSWWTLEGQTLTIEENAKFVIPEDVTLQVLSKVIVKGTATVDGTVNLYIADATVQAHEGLNITTTAGDKVLYQDGVYTVHSHTEDEPVVENKVDATCDADGSYDNVVYCATCGDKLSSETVTVPANGHTEGEVVVENEVAATCGTDGSYDNVVYCTVCDAELSRNTVVAPATGEHAYATEKERVEASCTEDGYLIKVCGCGAEETTVIPATGHTAGGAVKENVVDATCTTDGSYDSVVKCSICGTEISRETVPVEALGHNYVDGVCTVCCDSEEKLIFSSEVKHSLLLKDQIQIQYYFTVDTTITATKYGMLVWTSDEYAAEEAAFKSAKKDKIAYSSESVFDVNLSAYSKYFTADGEGMKPRELSNVYYAIPYAIINGEYIYGEIDRYSVCDYAETAFARGSDKLKIVMADLMRFAKRAQLYLDSQHGTTSDTSMFDAVLRKYGYATELTWTDSDAAAVPSADISIVQPEDVSNTMLKWAGNALLLKDQTGLAFIVKGHVSDSVEFLYWDEDAYMENCDNLHKGTESGTLVVSSYNTNYDQGVKTGISARLTSEVYYVRMHDTSTGAYSEIIATGTANYLAKMLNKYASNPEGVQVQFARAYLLYADSAKVYLDSIH